MKPNALLLAYDLGTSGVKAGLFSSDGKIVNSSIKEYPIICSRPGRAEQRAEDWWETTCNVTKSLLDRNPEWKKQIVCISFSGQMMGCLPVDQNGTPLYPSLIWADQRAVNEANFMKNCIGNPKLYEITGQIASPSFSAAKILWLKQNEPEVYRKTFKILNCKDYIVYKLTEKFCTDPSDASGTNLYSLKKGNWDSEIISSLNIDVNILPKIVPSTTVIGKVKPAAARKTGIMAGTPVVVGGGDGSTSGIGAGAIEPDDAFVSLGTSAWIARVSNLIAKGPEMRLTTEAHVVPNLFIQNGTTFNGTSPYNWLKDNMFHMEEIQSNCYKALEKLAEKSQPGADGIIFLPYLMGEKCPYLDPKARGAFLGLSYSHQNKDIVRAVIEGCAANLCLICNLFEEKGFKPERLRLIGGGASSDLWLKIISDMFDMPIEIPRLYKEASSLGAAIVGGVGIGLYSNFSIAKKLIEIEKIYYPTAKHAEEYKKTIKIFRQAYEALKPINEELIKHQGSIL